MKLFKILTPKTIFYLVLVLAAIIYYLNAGITADNETDFLITLFAISILSAIIISNIKSRILSIKKQQKTN